MKKIVLLSLLLLAAHLGRAQIFRPGWVVLAATPTDTLRAEIEDNAWDAPPTEVRLRAAAGADIQRFAPAQVRAFRLRGGRFFRYETLPLDRTAQTNANGLPRDNAPKNQPEAFLAEVLVDGPATLYYTSFDGVRHYVMVRAGRPPLPLADRRYISEREGRQLIMDGNNYRAELEVYFGDCPAATQAIGSFEPAALVAVAQAYNRTCATPARAGLTYGQSARRAPIGFALGLVLGGRYASGTLQAIETNATTTDLNGFNFGGGVHPVGGLEADVFAGGRRLSLHAAGLLTTIGRADETTTIGVFARRVANRATLLELRLGLRFYTSTGRGGQRLFGGTGLTLPQLLTGRDDLPVLIYGNGPGQSSFVTYLPDAYPIGLLPYLELGIQQGRFTFALDGRVQRAQTTRLLGYNQTLRFLTINDYTYRSWYLSATVGVALARRQ